MGRVITSIQPDYDEAEGIALQAEWKGNTCGEILQWNTKRYSCCQF